MISEGLLKLLNNVFEKKTFVYEGPVLAFAEYSSEPAIKFNYTLKIIKQKQMISVGEWTDYLVIDVFIKNYEGPFATLFDRLYNTDSFRLVLTNNLNNLFFKMGLYHEFNISINDIHLEENGI